MFVRPTNPISHRLARMAFISACVAALIVAAAGPLHRYLGLDIEAAIAVFRYGFYVAVAGVALGLATIVPTRPGDRRRGFVAAFLAIVIGVAGAWVPVQLVPVVAAIAGDQRHLDRHRQPAGHGRHSCSCGAARPIRRPIPAPPPPRSSAPPIPTSCRSSCRLPPAEAFKRADRVAMTMGWDVVARAPAEGRLEAVDTSDWFGFRDDIVVRIRAEGTGSRIDIRSKSRAGESDLGVNARRIRDFTARLKAER